MHGPSLGADLAALRARLDRLERSPRKGARDEPLPVVAYPLWTNNGQFRPVLEIGTGNLNLPVLRLDWTHVQTGTGTAEYRLYDVDTGAASSTYTVSSTRWCRADWLHPLAFGFARGGAWRRLLLHMRITSGTPSITVYPGLAYGRTTEDVRGATSACDWQTVTPPPTCY